MAYTYHSQDDLAGLGRQIANKAVDVTMHASDQYGYAQIQANNYAVQINEPVSGVTPVPGYTPPASTTQDDAANVRRFATAEFAGIPQLFTAFAIPDPAGCQSTIDALYRTAATLDPNLQVTLDNHKLYYPLYTGTADVPTAVSTTINFINLRMQNWQGTAAKAFSLYMGTFTESAQLQKQLTISLAVTLQAQMEIRQRMLSDVWNIGTLTIKALDALDGWCPNPSQLGLDLTITGAIAAVLLAIPTDGASLAVEGINSAASILTNLPAPKTHVTVGGQTVRQVIDSMHAALTKTHECVSNRQRDVVQCLQKISTEVSQASNQIQPTAPSAMTNIRTAGIDVLSGQHAFYDH